ncbi:hypothetical protein C2740_05675 [Polynucleobacter sp. MG-5-Ahmo-C2]|uniref:hypothetical protein n=1 Tax=Polynucleobacter sp. MG-5-Ahmo-C2 TaxID=2081051 RepID=UPI001BFD8990|nr:hypothetical protein [Polynucleobacter sp. MG-5-Ahmo-C2]QWD97854.1 hypothetical protein C2740_05675 [Polynucleobacter sp. MG-5-Ahmo-C2]
MENINYFVSSRGILRSTTYHNAQPRSSSPNIDIDLLLNSDQLEAIYICTDALENFSNNYLKNVKNRFNLVSGDSDLCINHEFLNSKSISNIIESPLLNHWFAQNLNVIHPKLSPIPIGMDYHTMHEIPGLWGLTKQSPLAQERALINVFSNAPKTFSRFTVGYCNWQFAVDRGDRKDCFEKIQKEFCFYEANRLPRLSTWQRQANCMFVISPEGAGIDCHRTWEAMLLGCIPIVKRSVFAEIFSDLPVILIEDWSECHRENIENIARQMNVMKFNYAKLFTRYWGAIINQTQPLLMDPMTMDEFRDYVCHDSY